MLYMRRNAEDLRKRVQSALVRMNCHNDVSVVKDPIDKRTWVKVSPRQKTRSYHDGEREFTEPLITVAVRVIGYGPEEVEVLTHSLLSLFIEAAMGKGWPD